MYVFTLFHLYFAHKKRSKDVFSFVFVFIIDMWFHLQPWLYFLPLLCYLVIKNKTVWNILQPFRKFKTCMHTWTELWHCWTWLLIDLDM